MGRTLAQKKRVSRYSKVLKITLTTTSLIIHLDYFNTTNTKTASRSLLNHSYLYPIPLPLPTTHSHFITLMIVNCPSNTILSYRDSSSFICKSALLIEVTGLLLVIYAFFSSLSLQFWQNSRLSLLKYATFLPVLNQ